MTDSEPPADPRHDPTAASAPASESGAATWAAGVGAGPAGWPGSIHADFRAAPAPDDAPPATARVEQVEARPITPIERRGPTIEVPAARLEPAASAPHPAPAPSAPPPSPTPPPAAAPAPQPESRVPPPIAPIPPASAPSAAERPPRKRWAILGHLAYLVPLPPHIAGIVLTTLIWVWKRKSSELVEDQGREALNFQLNYLAINTVLSVTCFGLGVVFTPLVWIVGAVLCVVAAVRTNDGERFRYPYIFRLIA